MPAFLSLLYFAILTEVAPWTVDLPEVRRYFFEKYDKEKQNDKNNVVADEDGRFDNIRGDSPHNTHVYGTPGEDRQYYWRDGEGDGGDRVYQVGKYADEYEYQSYMEKKVGGIVTGRGAYLEGLSEAVERFSEQLKNCSINSTQPSSPRATNTTWLPENERPFPDNSTSPDTSMCANATRAAEHVRRLAALALWAARELEDRDYAKNYQKPGHEQEEEESELVLRLAWFLDRLAYLTGFEPDGAPASTTERPSSSSVPVPTIMPVPDDVKLAMMRCLDDSNSTAPAYERCRYPLPLPDALRRLFNITDDPSASTASTPVSSSPASSELLAAAETVQSVRSAPARSVRAVRSVHSNPLVHLQQYYVKHKAWSGSNLAMDPDSKHSSTESFDVSNDLNVKLVHKRSIDNTKAPIHLPEDPMQDISSYVKHRPGVNYIRSEKQAAQIRQFLDKVYHHSSISKNNLRQLEKSLKSSRAKRSVHYEDMFKPRPAQDPQQDISYYVKRRPGTRLRSNPVQAAQVRAGLEQIFQRGNIEVVRRYGANYNPLVPNPLVAGALMTMADV